MEKKKGGPTILMKRYEIGPLLGQGNFAKVYSARHVISGETFAIKVFHKEKVLGASSAMSEQIKREISIMRRVRHPNIVQLHEVMATKTKIYFAMEYVKGGELLAKVAQGRLDEATSRKYFQQLVAAVDFCHSRGVYHRDLKPENLLLDENSNLKVSDFGLSAIGDSRRTDGLLHTRCGTPAYVAPEVLSIRGYDGAKADIWSCGIILFVLLAGFLPFRDHNIVIMYQKIARGEFTCPPWFPFEVKKLLYRILDPCPTTRLTIASILANPWVRTGFKKPAATESEQQRIQTESVVPDLKCASLNAFDIICRAPGLDLSGLFESGGERGRKRGQEMTSCFTTRKSAREIVSKLEEIAMTEKRFKVRKTEVDGVVVKLEGYKEGRKGQISIEAEIFQVTPTFHMVEMKKSAGDTWEYQRFYDQELKPKLKDIVWTWQHGGGGGGGDDHVTQGQLSSPPRPLASKPPLPPRPRAA